MNEVLKEIEKLKRERNAVILAHYYQRADVQEIADYVGDSYYLAQIGRDIGADVIIFCGVRFMAESAKILSPKKQVLLPVYSEAPCCMEFMAYPDEVKKMVEKDPKLRVVSYVNSSSAVKTVSDACVTSSSAKSIVENLDGDKILFIPDRNLASYVQEQVPSKEIIPWDGCCNIHDAVRREDIENALKEHGRDLVVVAHPECVKKVRDVAHYVGSTAGILKYVRESNKKRFLIVTEKGIAHEMRKQNKDKELIFLPMICKAMKKVYPETILKSLKEMSGEIQLPKEILEGARRSLDNMLKLQK